MKRIFLYFFLTFVAVLSSRGADGDLFPYPTPPADMERLDERCDYIISRFWRQCDFKSAMSKSEKLKSTFSDWISFMPYASADTVLTSIDKLLVSVSKSGEHTLALAKLAEEYAYSDTSDIRSAEIFLPFAKAAARHKKISSADKEHFSKMIQRIENSQTGKPVGHLDFVSVEGTRQNLDNYRTQMVAVIFADHNSSDASLARVRISADHNANTLIERGLLTIIYLEPGPASADWQQASSTYPANWVVGAMPDANDWFELYGSPSILLLDGRHKVLAKDLNTDALLLMMAHARQQAGL